MRVRAKLVVLVTLVALAVTVPNAGSVGSSTHTAKPSTTTTTTTTELHAGKGLYDRFCMQCHDLMSYVCGLGCGYGIDKRLGTDIGPAFDDLNIPYGLSIAAVNGAFEGHERVTRLVSWSELRQIAVWVAFTTRNNPRG